MVVMVDTMSRRDGVNTGRQARRSADRHCDHPSIPSRQETRSSPIVFEELWVAAVLA